MQLDFFYPAILHAAQEGIWVTDAQGATVYVNPRMAELLQSTEEEMMQKSRLDFLFPEDYQMAFRLNQHPLPCQAEAYECRYRMTDGRERWTYVTTGPICDTQNNYHGAVAMHTDISDRKRTEHDLAKSQEDIWLIIDSVKDYAIMILDHQRRVISWNSGAEQMFGYNSHEITGQYADMIFTDEDNRNHVPEKEMERAILTGHASDDRWHRRKDGSTIFVNGVMTLLNKAGEPNKFIKIVRDWTEQKKMEEVLKNADQHKNEFLATLAHELRNPLASINSGLEVLRHEKDTGTRIQTQEAIERQTQQMIHLVNDLLDISRISQGKIKINKVPIYINDAINLALDTSRPIIKGHRHALTVALTSEPLVVDGDITRLCQVFLNILINSAKYTPPGGLITLSASRENNDVIIRTRDNGMGIPVHMLSNIFNMFEQIQDRREYPQAGLGIGLSVVKQLVEMHGGHVLALSEGENHGSEFVVSLPLCASQVQVHHTAPPEPVAPAALQTGAVAGKRVLLVDDNADAADMMDILLRKRGYEIRKAYDGKSGISAAMDFNPQIVMLDLGLPDIDGYEVLKTLQGLPGQRTYIAVSGWGQEEDLRRSVQAGFHHHLVKPVDFKTIDALLTSV